MLETNDFVYQRQKKIKTNALNLALGKQLKRQQVGLEMCVMK